MFEVWVECFSIVFVGNIKYVAVRTEALGVAQLLYDKLKGEGVDGFYWKKKRKNIFLHFVLVLDIISSWDGMSTVKPVI